MVIDEAWVTTWTIAFLLIFVLQTIFIAYMWYRLLRTGKEVEYLKKVHEESAMGTPAKFSSRQTSLSSSSSRGSSVPRRSALRVPQRFSRPPVHTHDSFGVEMSELVGHSVLSPAAGMTGFASPQQGFPSPQPTQDSNGTRGAFAVVNEVEKRTATEQRSLDARVSALERTLPLPSLTPSPEGSKCRSSPQQSQESDGLGALTGVRFNPNVSQSVERPFAVSIAREGQGRQAVAVTPQPTTTVVPSRSPQQALVSKPVLMPSIPLTNVPKPSLVCLLNPVPSWVDPSTASHRYMLPHQMACESDGQISFAQMEDVHSQGGATEGSDNVTTAVPVSALRDIVIFPPGAEGALGADTTEWFPLRLDHGGRAFSLPLPMLKGPEDRWCQNVDCSPEGQPSPCGSEGVRGLVVYFLTEPERAKWAEWLQVSQLVPALPCDVEYPKPSSCAAGTQQAQPEEPYANPTFSPERAFPHQRQPSAPRPLPVPNTMDYADETYQEEQYHTHQAHQYQYQFGEFDENGDESSDDAFPSEFAPEEKPTAGPTAAAGGGRMSEGIQSHLYPDFETVDSL